MKNKENKNISSYHVRGITILQGNIYVLLSNVWLLKLSDKENIEKLFEELKIYIDETKLILKADENNDYIGNKCKDISYSLDEEMFSLEQIIQDNDLSKYTPEYTKRVIDYQDKLINILLLIYRVGSLYDSGTNEVIDTKKQAKKTNKDSNKEDKWENEMKLKARIVNALKLQSPSDYVSVNVDDISKLTLSKLGINIIFLYKNTKWMSIPKATDNIVIIGDVEETPMEFIELFWEDIFLSDGDGSNKDNSYDSFKWEQETPYYWTATKNNQTINILLEAQTNQWWYEVKTEIGGDK